MGKENWQILQSCGKDAEGLDIILACDGEETTTLDFDEDDVTRIANKIVEDLSY